ncbi:MAG: transposase [Chlorobi bacterium]|nr:transposase [Chlorobiota bacterium]
MKHDSYGRPAGRPNRRSIRLKGYDYTQPGAYFITIVTQDRTCLFGEVVDGEMRLNALGEIVRACWLGIPGHFPHAALDAFMVMPNHVHGIIVIADYVGARHAVPLHTVPLRQRERFGKPVAGSIPTIIRSFKSIVTKRINEHRKTPGVPVWQRNYYEHIIRSDESLNRIRQYIVENPLRWAFDLENPIAESTDTEKEPWHA